jgi:hypothetical protein
MQGFKNYFASAQTNLPIQFFRSPRRGKFELQFVVSLIFLKYPKILSRSSSQVICLIITFSKKTETRCKNTVLRYLDKFQQNLTFCFPELLPHLPKK